MPIFPLQNPPPAKILDATGFSPPFASGIPSDLECWQRFPSDFEEFGEGYSETEDERGGLVVTRCYVGPWSSRARFRLWAMGYNIRKQPLSPGDGSPVPGPAPISRILPAQDPEHTFLRCSSIRLSRAMGAVIVDPVNEAVDINGNTVMDAISGKPVVIPAVAYVNNSEAGAVALNYDDFNLATPTPVQGGQFLDGRCTYILTFSSHPYEMRTDAQAAVFTYPEMSRFLERRYSPSIEALPMNRLASAGTASQQLLFSDPAFLPNPSTSAIPEAGIWLTPSMTISLRWYAVPDPPFALLQSLMGKVNLTAFDGEADGFPGYISFPPETLLWMQPQWERRPCDGTGAVLFNVFCNLGYRPQTWNRFPVPGGIGATPDGYALATFGGDGKSKLYQLAEFHDIFQPSPTVKWF